MTGIAEEAVWDPSGHRERATASRSRSTLKGVPQARSRLRPLEAADRQRDDENCCARAALIFPEKIWTLLSTAAMELSGGWVVGSERT
jgi:hypothetical protein